MAGDNKNNIKIQHLEQGEEFAVNSDQRQETNFLASTLLSTREENQLQCLSH